MHTLSKTSLAAACTSLLLPTAAADPFPGADAAIGQKLHARHCVACHASRFGSVDGADLYTRTQRRVNTAEALGRQIRFCTAQLNLNLFPEDEQHLAGYLNQHYYKFK